jgi:hypothetical protein
MTGFVADVGKIDNFLPKLVCDYRKEESGIPQVTMMILTLGGKAIST